MEFVNVRYHIGESEGTTVISFEGILDVSNGRVVRTVLMDLVGKAHRIVVDLSGVVEADTVLAANLVEAAQAARERSISLVLRGVAPAVRRVLEVSRLCGVLAFEPGTAAC